MFTFDKIYERFDTTETTATGYTDFIEVGEDSEWGVDVVMLREQRDGNHEVAYRLSNPMVDESWKVGTLEDVVEAANEQTDNLNEFLTTEDE